MRPTVEMGYYKILHEEYDTLAWRYAADLPMTTTESDRLLELHGMFMKEVKDE